MSAGDIEDFIVAVFFPTPLKWPLWARRAFVLGLPVFGPALLLWWVIGGCVVAALLVLGVMAWMLAWAIQPMFSLASLISNLWSRP